MLMVFADVSRKADSNKYTQKNEMEKFRVREYPCSNSLPVLIGYKTLFTDTLQNSFNLKTKENKDGGLYPKQSFLLLEITENQSRKR